MTRSFRRVLLVDDCEMFRQRTARILTSEGYVVQTAENGLEALEILKMDPIDYVITDWDMPELDGALLCRQIRSDFSNERYVYVIMMTGFEERADVTANFAAGIDDFMIKPVKRAELLARMEAGARVLQRDRELSFQAQRDPLTRLLNRRSMTARLAATAEYYRRMGKPLSCIMLDIDHFKSLNDQYGHPAGDDALISVAQTLSSSVRATDDVFRYGGEEFLLVLPTAALRAAEQCADRCRVEISEINMESYGIPHRITASFGVAEMDLSQGSISDMIERADKALMRAKQSGRNRVESDLSICTTGSTNRF